MSINSTNEKWDTINKLKWSQINLKLKEVNSDIVYVLAWHYSWPVSQWQYKCVCVRLCPIALYESFWI